MTTNGQVDLGLDLDLRDGYGDAPALTRPPDFAWHRGDRCVVRASGQLAVVEGWKGDRLLVFFGSANGRDYRDWVPEAGCDWMPAPGSSSG